MAAPSLALQPGKAHLRAPPRTWTAAELVVGTKLACRTAARGDAGIPCEIVEIRKVKTQSGEGIQYYVHFINCDKRLDEWVNVENFDLGSVDEITRLVETLNPLSPMSPENKFTRHQKRKHDEVTAAQQSVEDLPATMQSFEKEHEEATKIRNIDAITLGDFEIDTWYFSPYPAEIIQGYTRLFICEYTLKPIASQISIQRHEMKNQQTHPPGEEIYRYDAHGAGGVKQVSFWEIDGAKEKIYCQNLCLLSKLFLDHKTCFFDVEPFFFYVLTEVDERGHHIAAYFSKEKETPYDYNLACILTLPPYQRKGYGKLMISLSYELSQREGRKGSPEKPLSDLGQISYKSFWTDTLIALLRKLTTPTREASLEELSDITGFQMTDVVWTLQNMNMVRYYKGEYQLNATQKQLDDFGTPRVDSMPFVPENLRWEPWEDAPFSPGRNQNSSRAQSGTVSSRRASN